MKNLFIWTLLLCSLSMGACIDRDTVDRKEGISLPEVENLQLAALENERVRLNWVIPELPDGIELPVQVFIEVREVVGPLRVISVFTGTLANAPTEFIYELPESDRSYQLTVKLQTNVSVRDPMKSSTLYSLGKTVVYEP